ncbi:hypothetical protein C8R48DRAFT_669216 [Suillus tomentosus]|nr:hypothetical protein C8R48DRAFT_669216 [Suillus tomentosus]
MFGFKSLATSAISSDFDYYLVVMGVLRPVNVWHISHNGKGWVCEHAGGPNPPPFSDVGCPRRGEVYLYVFYRCVYSVYSGQQYYVYCSSVSCLWPIAGEECPLMFGDANMMFALVILAVFVLAGCTGAWCGLEE